MLQKLKEAWQFASVKLAALVAALVGMMAGSPDLLLGVISLIPVDPLQRGMFAVGVGVIAFFGPTLVRMWPQNIGLPKGDNDAG